MQNMAGILICTSEFAGEMKSEGLKLGDEFPVEIVSVEGAIKRKVAPGYVYFRCRRGLALSEEGRLWPKDHPLPDKTMHYRLIPTPESWNGDDLFGATNRDWLSLMVSRRREFFF